MLQNNPTLKSLIDKLWNNFWSGGIANPLTAIEQITYLLFMKQLDKNETIAERNIAEGYIEEKDYNFRFKGKYQPPGTTKEKDAIDKNDLRWSVFKHMPAEAMLLHIQTKVFPFLRDLNKLEEEDVQAGKKKKKAEENPFTKHMANAVFIMPKASLLVEAINIIEDIFKEIDKDAVERGQAFQDIQGDVYEMLLSEIATAGKMGQFRTPRHIIKLMAALVQPQLGQLICDPACGTGGFLLGAYQYILTDLVRKKSNVKLELDEDGFETGSISKVLTENVKQRLKECFTGYDIDETMVRLGLMNLMMHGIDNPNINNKDTLDKNFNDPNPYSLIMANPPFTGNLDTANLFENRRTDTRKTELLFIERIFNMLKMGGTAAIIVPQGVLFGAGRAFVEIRKMMVEEAELKAVITMPSGVFKPYAGVATSILIFTKASETKDVWFYEMQNDGYSLDDKRNKIPESDLQDIIEKYHNRENNGSDRKLKHFFIPKAEIAENDYDLSLTKYREEDYKPKEYDEPKLIFEKLKTIEENISKGIIEIERLLK
jgi:type I restriction enzyme M protein